jgi:hypothetical protein
MRRAENSGGSVGTGQNPFGRNRAGKHEDFFLAGFVKKLDIKGDIQVII